MNGSESVEAPTAGSRVMSGLRAVSLPEVGILVPDSCAGCCAPASLSLRELRGRDGATVIVPYCAVCHRHATSATTRLMGVVASSALLAFTTALTLPLLFDRAGRATILALSVAAALVPTLFALWRGRHRFGGVPRPWLDRAAWWGTDGRLVCVCVPWAQALAARNRSSSEYCRGHRGRRVAWLFVGPLVALVAAPLSFNVFNARVRLLNLTDAPITVGVVGGRMTLVHPSSTESPSAGAWTRWPSGAQRVHVRSESGALIAEDLVFVQPGQEHLYAPLDGDTCFWLESDGYGKSGPSTRLITALAKATRFWVLPEVDTWFGPNPSKPQDDRSTGGRLRALRQAPCEEAPTQARAPEVSGTAE